MSQVAPTYPSELRKAKIEGTVTLVFLLTEDGRVGSSPGGELVPTGIREAGPGGGASLAVQARHEGRPGRENPHAPSDALPAGEFLTAPTTEDGEPRMNTNGHERRTGVRPA